MKSSELIQRIQEHISQYGDNDVIIIDAFCAVIGDVTNVTAESRPDHPTDTGMCICLQSE